MDLPPPYSPTPEVHSTIAQPRPLIVRWHPKITPFRLFVLLTTVILGTVKAVFTYRGESSISTTFEWITGVIITLMFFVLGEWESKENYPKLLQWFFASDCTELIWIATRVFSLPRPVYRSDELSPVVITSTSISVSITGYRILVSAVVITLGSIKATLAYLGHNTTANTTDWILGVFATSLLYYIGLYEPNSVNLAPSFFSRNYSSPVSRIVRGVAIIIALALAMYLCVQWVRFSLYAVKMLGVFSTTTTSNSLSLLLYSLKVCLLSTAFLSLTSSLFCSLAILTWIIWGWRQELALILAYAFRRRMFAEAYDRFAPSVLSATFLSSEVLSLQQSHHARRIGSFFLQTVINLFLILGVITLIHISIGIVMVLSKENAIENGISGDSIGILITQFLVGGLAVVLVIMLLTYLFRLLVPPFLSPPRLTV